jgi:hypothetical protein
MHLISIKVVGTVVTGGAGASDSDAFCHFHVTNYREKLSECCVCGLSGLCLLE